MNEKISMHDVKTQRINSVSLPRLVLQHSSSAMLAIPLINATYQCHQKPEAFVSTQNGIREAGLLEWSEVACMHSSLEGAGGFMRHQQQRKMTALRAKKRNKFTEFECLK